jgi:Skp family chaperone for outer membrane proteins
MTKFVRFMTAVALAMPVTALAQSSSAAALPAAPSSASAAPAAAPSPTGTKIATINIEQAIFASNEGQRDFETLSKKLEPKQTELKSLNEELDSLKKQLNVQEGKLSEEARTTLVGQISQKQKVFDRNMQDARDDMQAQQNEIAQKILQKMAPLMMKYATDNGYGLMLDTTQPWPQGPVVMAGPSFDITRAIVEAYNAQSGVAAPANPSRPAATRTPGSTTKPATTKPATTPATTTPAPK